MKPGKLDLEKKRAQWLAATRRYQARHPERVAAYKQSKRRPRILLDVATRKEHDRLCTKRWKARNLERVRATHKRWAAKKTPTFLHHKHKYRAAKRAVHFEHCGGKIALLRLERFCRWCCTKLSDKNRHIDHVIPLTRGGLHVPDNLVASCVQCNVRRHNKLVSEWLPYQDFALSNPGN